MTLQQETSTQKLRIEVLARSHTLWYGTAENHDQKYFQLHFLYFQPHFLCRKCNPRQLVQLQHHNMQSIFQECCNEHFKLTYKQETNVHAINTHKSRQEKQNHLDKRVQEGQRARSQPNKIKYSSHTAIETQEIKLKKKNNPLKDYRPNPKKMTGNRILGHRVDNPNFFFKRILLACTNQISHTKKTFLLGVTKTPEVYQKHLREKAGKTQQTIHQYKKNFSFCSNQTSICLSKAFERKRLEKPYKISTNWHNCCHEIQL